MEGEVLTEVPINLQKLVQMVVRGFYTVEDMLVVDMLIRNLCLSEDNICDLLKFDRKMLRQRINTLKTDKLLQTKLKMISTEDGKAQREQYYFINYKSFVNVVKYKLDHIRKKLEMEERDQTSRASFVCNVCQRTYTDLEADQLLDLTTGQLVCIICRQEVQEDMSAAPRGDSRQTLTRFNEQLEPLFSLLKEVENIKLSAEFSDPSPQELTNGKKTLARPSKGNNNDSRAWSGDSTKRQGFHVEGSIDVNINTENQKKEVQKTKEAPSWLSQTSALITTNISGSSETNNAVSPDDVQASTGLSVGSGGVTVGGATEAAAAVVVAAATTTTTATTTTAVTTNKANAKDNVLSLLQAHESKSKRSADPNNSDSDDSVEELPAAKKAATLTNFSYNESSMDGVLDSDDEDNKDEVESAPLITVGRESIPINEVDNSVIARMTQEEKNLYIHAYQEYMAGMDDL